MTIDHDALRRSARADLRFGLGGESARDVLALLDALTRVEAQSETRRLQVAYWQDQYGQMEADRDEWKRLFNDCHPIHLDGILRAREAEARIKAVEYVLDSIDTSTEPALHDGFADIRRALEG